MADQIDPQMFAMALDPNAAFMMAAQRQRGSAIRPATAANQGGLTYAPEALAMSPWVFKEIISDLAGKAQSQGWFGGKPE